MREYKSTKGKERMLNNTAVSGTLPRRCEIPGYVRTMCYWILAQHVKRTISVFFKFLPETDNTVSIKCILILMLFGHASSLPQPDSSHKNQRIFGYTLQYVACAVLQ